MEIKIGKLKVELSSASLYAGASPAKQKLVRMVRRKARREIAYRWNCNTQSGTPAQRPARVRVTTEYILAPHREVIPFGPISTYPTEQAWHAAADLTESDFTAKLKEHLPDLVLPLDWSKYGEPFKDQYSFDIVVQTQFLLVFGRPKGMTMKDHMFILTPSDVTIMPVVTGRCGGTEPNGTVLGGFSFHRAAFTDPEHAPFAELEPIITEETEEARAMRERLREELGEDPYWEWYYR